MTPRVCVVSALYHPSLGGLGRQAQLLTEGLRRAGVELFVIARRMRDMPPAEFASDVDVIRIPAPWPRTHILEERSFKNLAISVSFSLGCALRLVRERRRYDLVHFHGASLPLFFALPLLKGMGKKVVAKVAAANLGTEAGSLAGRYAGLGSGLARLARRVDAFVAISDEIRAGLLRDGVDEASIHRLNNFVDTDRFRPSLPGERAILRGRLDLPPVPVVLFAGRLVPRKGVDVLLDAWRRLADLYPAPCLIVLGEGSERRRLETLAKENGLDARVRFVGAVEHVHEYLRAADLFVLPSLQEGMPNALLEALASGLPAVATRIGGVKDIAGAGAALELVEPGLAEELASGLRRMLVFPARREALAKAARTTIEQTFGLQARVSEYQALYGRVLTATRQRSEGC